MFSYITHDVTATTRGVVAHGCNCQGVMGSGVALAIRNKWNVAYQRYVEFVSSTTTNNPSNVLLGLAQIINVGHPLIDEPNSLFVSNMFTQDQFGRDGKRYADPSAIRRALTDTISFCQGANLPLYIPRIGCGLGGLVWEQDVQPIVEEVVSLYSVEVFVCDLP